MLRCCSAAADWCRPPWSPRPAARPRSAPGRSTQPRPTCSTPAGSKPARPQVDDTPPGFAAGAPQSAKKGFWNKEVMRFVVLEVLYVCWLFLRSAGQCQLLDTFLGLAGIPAWVTIRLKVGSVVTHSFCLFTSFSPHNGKSLLGILNNTQPLAHMLPKQQTDVQKFLLFNWSRTVLRKQTSVWMIPVLASQEEEGGSASMGEWHSWLISPLFGHVRVFRRKMLSFGEGKSCQVSSCEGGTDGQVRIPRK